MQFPSATVAASICQSNRQSLTKVAMRDMIAHRRACGLHRCSVHLPRTPPSTGKCAARTTAPVGVASCIADTASEELTQQQQQDAQQVKLADSVQHIHASALANIPAADTDGGDVDATRRRRRRATSSRMAVPEARASAAKAAQQEAKDSLAKLPMHKLFQQQQQQSNVKVNPVGQHQAAHIPENALADPLEALQLHKKPSRFKRRASDGNEQQQHTPIDAQLVAQFQPFSQAFQALGQQRLLNKATLQQHQRAASSADTLSAAEGRGPGLEGEVDDADGSRSRRQWGSSRSGQATRLIELFGMAEPQIGQHVVSVKRLPKGAALQPAASQAKEAAKKLATMLLQQQQQAASPADASTPGVVEDDLHNLANPTATQLATATPAAAATAAAVSAARPSRLLTTAVPQVDTTRIYVPVPSISEASSAAERQPLRLLSIRQQQQMRQEARQAAINRVREKTVRDYQSTLDQLLTWQGKAQRSHLPAPTHLPVAVQQNWTAAITATSSSPAQSSAHGSAVEPLEPAAPDQNVAGTAAAAMKELSPEDQAVVRSINRIVQKQLGQPVQLPDRALRGERGLLLAALSPAAVAERLGNWVACCGAAFVSQLMVKEPCLLAHEPQVLLRTLEGLNQQLQLPSQDCVPYVLKNVVVVGLDGPDIEGRVQGLATAVGLDWDQAVKLAAAQPSLLMLTSEHLKERMAALAQLLPEAVSKLPRAVLRHPFLLVKSPRAVARSIQDLAAALGLSSWAASRLVAGQPSILASNFDVLQRRLERLQELTSASRRWRQQLQEMSPATLARCLTCSDDAVNRLAVLAEVGAANSPRIPPVQFILTKPAGYFDEMLADVAERELHWQRQQQQLRGFSIEPDEAEAEKPQAGVGRGNRAVSVNSRNSSSSSSTSHLPGDDPEGMATTSGATTRAKQLARMTTEATMRRINGSSSSSSGGGSSASPGKRSDRDVLISTAEYDEDDEVAPGTEVAKGGVLQLDSAWRDSLTSALSKTAADFKKGVLSMVVVQDSGSSSSSSSSSRRRVGVKAK